jgi:hypothetical protein
LHTLHTRGKAPRTGERPESQDGRLDLFPSVLRLLPLIRDDRLAGLPKYALYSA